MTCKICGREILSSQANFCEYCGTSTREDVFLYQVNKETDSNRNYTSFASAKETQNNNRNFDHVNTTLVARFFQSLADESNPVTFRQWMAIMLSVFVPTIGPFFYLGILFVFSFNSRIKKSLKNWARATLIMFGISFFALAMILPEFMSMLNGMM